MESLDDGLPTCSVFYQMQQWLMVIDVLTNSWKNKTNSHKSKVEQQNVM